MVLGNDRAAVSCQQPDVELVHTLVQAAVLEPGEEQALTALQPQHPLSPTARPLAIQLSRSRVSTLDWQGPGQAYALSAEAHRQVTHSDYCMCRRKGAGGRWDGGKGTAWAGEDPPT